MKEIDNLLKFPPPVGESPEQEDVTVFLSNFKLRDDRQIIFAARGEQFIGWFAVPAENAERCGRVLKILAETAYPD